MDDLFSIGELAKCQRISKQTLIYYDKIGLFRPAWVDPDTGYRYYSARQLDDLDTILIMKKIGFSLEEIKNMMKTYTTASSMAFFHRQMDVIEGKIRELSLIQNRLKNRCRQIEEASAHKKSQPELLFLPEQKLLCCPVEPPYGPREISIATKKCYAQALEEDIPIYFQCGVSVPLERVLEGRCTQAGLAFVSTEADPRAANIRTLEPGWAACIYHFGNYYRTGDSYRRLLAFCRDQNLEIISDSYEFCINDYITSRYEEEFITKILFYVRKPEKNGAAF